MLTLLFLLFLLYLTYRIVELFFGLLAADWLPPLSGMLSRFTDLLSLSPQGFLVGRLFWLVKFVLLFIFAYIRLTLSLLA
ncbi:hypothetical protein KDH_26660 [Dictyobacter sp. S3.2.2.5]|uniref:YggT family protein n=1 Tax=Dictyobacter halimunensis TaxID=3026934 RepID=A0ABQ6FTS2_9CHLR|nr:hypothetical protein KDH_26660 [Dictyobacter sp. S3.2.2.5]